MKQLLIFIVTLISVMSAWSQGEILFEEGNKLYNEGKFAEAIEKYEAILASNEHSAAVYFNLANAHYKLNNIAPSIYYYEKAVALDPNDREIKNNLAFAQNMTVDAIGSVPEVGFSRIYKSVVNSVSYDAWAKIAVLSMLVFVLLFLFYHFSYATAKKRIAFVVSVISLLISVSSVFMAFQNYSLYNDDKPAIVFAQESKVKTEPNLRSEEAFRLHEGTKVQVLDTVKSWHKIKLADGTMGWIPSKDIKLIRKF
ncbi:MAG: tetratricopeptide repeat protein [Bacteroidia bacterium]|nr:tetratricopeptide repeat protein [Bacteroidia bacterium]